MCVLRYSRKKKACLDYENKEFKNWQNWDLSMVLLKKLRFSIFLFFGKIGQEKVFDDVLDR